MPFSDLFRKRRNDNLPPERPFVRSGSLPTGGQAEKRTGNSERVRLRSFGTRIEQAKNPADTKWVIGLLLGSILLSLAFWGWGKLSRREFNWRLDSAGSTSSIQLTPTPTLTPKRTEEVTDKIQAITRKISGTWGVYVFNLTTKQAYGLNEKEIFTAASLIKLPVILTLYQEAERGKVDLEAKYLFQAVDKREGAGSLQYKPIGTTVTYRELARLMGQQSDNTAFAAASRILGTDKIQITLDSLGMSKTSFEKNETTPEDIGLFFRKLYGGSLVTREHRDEILGFLTNTIYEDRLPAGVPEGVRVAHKIGTEIGIFSDAGIIFAERPHVLVIMSKNALEKEAKETLPEITKAVWEFETGE